MRTAGIKWVTGFPDNPNLGQITGKEQERIMSMKLGLGIEDMPVAARVYERAEKLRIGE
mgnify:FL=1